MKDWVFRALDEAGELERLHQFAGREIKGCKDFGRFLTSASPWMDTAQLATAAKHFRVSEVTGPEIVTSFDFQFEPGAAARDLSGREETMVATHGDTIAGPDLVLLLDFIWSRALVEPGLLDAAGAE